MLHPRWCKISSINSIFQVAFYSGDLVWISIYVNRNRQRNSPNGLVFLGHTFQNHTFWKIWEVVLQMFVGQHLDGGCLTLYNYISHISAHGVYVKMNQPHRMIPKNKWTMLHDLLKLVQKEHKSSHSGLKILRAVHLHSASTCHQWVNSRCSKAIIGWWTILSTKRGSKKHRFYSDKGLTFS